MKHFLDINQLSYEEIQALSSEPVILKQRLNFLFIRSFQSLICFMKNSTRTRVSFELAAKHLSMPVVNLDLQTSSEKKGESIKDTMKTLAAMEIKLFVIRHEQAGLPKIVSEVCQDGIHII